MEGGCFKCQLIKSVMLDKEIIRDDSPFTYLHYLFYLIGCVHAQIALHLHLIKKNGNCKTPATISVWQILPVSFRISKHKID